MGDQLADLLRRNAVVEGALEMTLSCSVRFSATSAAHVMRLRSRLDSPWPLPYVAEQHFSVRSMSLGTVARTLSRVADGGVGFVVMNALLLVSSSFKAAWLACVHVAAEKEA